MRIINISEIARSISILKNCRKIVFFFYLYSQSNECSVAVAVAEAGSMAAMEEASGYQLVTQMAKSEGWFVVLFSAGQYMSPGLVLVINLS